VKSNFKNLITNLIMTISRRQTVEFLYEDNGGLPRDLHLPTADDVKKDMAKINIEDVKR